MSSPKASKYSFLPWVKTGLGASIRNNEKELVGPRAKIQAKLSVRVYDEANNSSVVPISKDFFLYGPGDIEGILNTVIIRIEPIANTINFEPNYFPFIEFSQPDFPWKYTPARPVREEERKKGRLSPWIALIVLEEDEFEGPTPTNSGSLPQIEIKKPKNSLPDLKQSWAWAHTQIVQELENEASFKEILDHEPYKVTSRVLSLRKLKKNTGYSAFLVPTFELGRLAGLGLPPRVDATGTTFAWNLESNSPHPLPVYYQWKFSTGAGGDFESLAKRLRYREISIDVGIKKLDVSEAFLSAGSKIGFKKPLVFGGALWSALAENFVSTRRKINLKTYRIESPQPEEENPSPQEIKDFIMEMKELVDLGERLTWSFVGSPQLPSGSTDPVISPPMYGKWHAGKKLVSNISDNYDDPRWVNLLDLPVPHPLIEKVREYSPNENIWIEELNLDPTNRVAAGLGTAVIRRIQEELMASAWDQAGQLRESNKHLRNSQLAREISSNIYQRSVKPLEQYVLIRMSRTFHSRVMVEEDEDNNEKKSISVQGLLRRAGIPDSILSPSFTKINTKYQRIQRNKSGLGHGTLSILDHFIKRGNRDSEAAVLEASEPADLVTLDFVVNYPIIDGPIKEAGFRGTKLESYLGDTSVDEDERKMVRSIESSIPIAGSTVEELQGVLEDTKAILEKIHQGLIQSLDPEHTIVSKVLKEVKRPERLREKTKDQLDIVVAYPEFKRPMFEPLRDLYEDFLFPGMGNIPQETIGILKTNPVFINSYMVGLNHEMARELLWRGYQTDQRGSYFRQFWDVSAAVERERLKLPQEEDEKIIEKYRDIPEIHRWNESKHQDIQRIAQREGEDQAERDVLLIRGELLMRYPDTVIYASRAIPDVSNNDKPRLSLNDDDIKEPIFRGTIPPDITFLGFDIPTKDFLANGEHPLGYFFIIQEQPSEPRFGIDNGNDSTEDDDLPQSWDELKWSHVNSSLGPNNYIDLEMGPLKDLELEPHWGTHAADLAYILLQKPFRMVVHAKELLKGL
jgi:hypothetical protein